MHCGAMCRVVAIVLVDGACMKEGYNHCRSCGGQSRMVIVVRWLEPLGRPRRCSGRYEVGSIYKIRPYD